MSFQIVQPRELVEFLGCSNSNNISIKQAYYDIHGTYYPSKEQRGLIKEAYKQLQSWGIPVDEWALLFYAKYEVDHIAQVLKIREAFNKNKSIKLKLRPIE